MEQLVGALYMRRRLDEQDVPDLDTQGLENTACRGDGVRLFLMTMEWGCVYGGWSRKKINQKINKTLKSLQSTEPNPAATSSSFTQKDSQLFWVDEADSKYSAGEAECTSKEHVCFIWGWTDNIQYTLGTKWNILQASFSWMLYRSYQPEACNLWPISEVLFRNSLN